LGNVQAGTLATIDANLLRADASVMRLKTENGYLVCSFSPKRYNKDKYETQKQVDRAK